MTKISGLSESHDCSMPPELPDYATIARNGQK